MNILVIFERPIMPNQGGVERVSYLLAQSLSKRGYNFYFLSTGREGMKGENKSESSNLFFQKHLYIGSSDFQSKFKELILERDIDAVLLQGANKDVVKVLNYIPEGIKRYLVLHNRPLPGWGFEREIIRLTPRSVQSWKRKLINMIGLISPRLYKITAGNKTINDYKHIADNVDKFIFLSKRYIDRIKRYIPEIDHKKLAAIVNPNTFNYAVQEISVKENIILFVGRLSHPQKNVTGFIDVWKIFSEKHPNWKALVVGDGEHRDIITKYAEKKGVRNISFEGNRPNISDYYSRSKILCMTSCYEGWPMVLAEAMAYGCVPVVYDTFEAVYDIVDSGISGIIVPPFDTAQMTTELSKLADNEPIRLKMGQTCQEKIKEFDIEKIADQWELLFKQ